MLLVTTMETQNNPLYYETLCLKKEDLNYIVISYVSQERHLLAIAFSSLTFNNIVLFIV